MKTLLNLEEAAILIATYAATLYLGFAWWLFFAWLLAPDLSMVGYALNTRIGAFLYNLVHHKATGVLVFMAGLYIESDPWMFAGLVLVGHSAMDRIFGYGLKYADDFKHTHLGWIGGR